MSARLIYLMDDEKCPLCLKENQHILFTACPEQSSSDAGCGGDSCERAACEKSVEQSLQKLSVRTRPMQSERRNVFFASPETRGEVRRLLAFACQLCAATFPSLPPLRTHYSRSHRKLLCDECLDHRKSFPSELELFDHRGLKEHKSSGDGSFHGHVWCCFCMSYFYNAEAARAHCIKQHELCVFCEEKRFYRNFECLEQHWKRVHYTCEYPTCIRQKVYAFKFKGELMQHLMRCHSVRESRIESRAEEDLEFMEPMAKEITWARAQPGAAEHRTAHPQQAGAAARVPRPESSSPGERGAGPRPLQALSCAETQGERNAFPSFLDRSSLLADRSQRQLRMQILRKNTPHFETVDGLLDRLNSGALDPKRLVSEMEIIMAPREVHKLLGTVIGFVHDRKSLASVLKSYKEQIDFPKYRSKAPEKGKPREAARLGYRVFDFTRK
ncbi:UNVERIFIED_CONTAM: hypothetical protein PYX00_011595 [Menopon gallinae]|uniref:C2H2-type domain-containing protein n=1 Tax=Menopon gallinae TaxID=328185 RepID=A0AAW2H8R4_9NEOP